MKDLIDRYMIELHKMKNLIEQIKLLKTINQKSVKDKKFLLEKEKNIEV